MTRVTFGVVAVVGFAVAACGLLPGTDWGPLAVVRDEVGPDALATGVLTIEGPCVHLVTGDRRLLLLWPESPTAWHPDIGEISFERANGTSVSVRDGTRLSAGGGETGVAGHDWVAEPDASCGDASWLVSDVMPE